MMYSSLAPPNLIHHVGMLFTSQRLSCRASPHPKKMEGSISSPTISYTSAIQDGGLMS